MCLCPQHLGSSGMPQAAGKPHFLGGFIHTEHDTSADTLAQCRYFNLFRVANNRTSSDSSTAASNTCTICEAGDKCTFPKCRVDPHLKPHSSHWSTFWSQLCAYCHHQTDTSSSWRFMLRLAMLLKVTEEIPFILHKKYHIHHKDD